MFSVFSSDLYAAIKENDIHVMVKLDLISTTPFNMRVKVHIYNQISPTV